MAAKNILVVPTDFSERSLTALAWVRKMAEAMQADIRCIYVVEEPQIYSTLDMAPLPPTFETYQDEAEAIRSFGAPAD